MDLDNLIIKNFDNREFISEIEVYEYLQEFKKFLVRYNDSNVSTQLAEIYEDEELTVFSLWQQYLYDLIVELFNSFVSGNFITSTAMTRTLIECYVYLSILVSEKENSGLAQDWLLYNIVSMSKKSKNTNFKERTTKILKEYCSDVGSDYQLILKKFRSKEPKTKGKLIENGWLVALIPEYNGRISFQKAYEYLKEPKIYNDFRLTSSFIHAQDMDSKLAPFTFYNSIFNRLCIMVDYIFRALQAFPLENELLKEAEELKYKLIVLRQKLDL